MILRFPCTLRKPKWRESFLAELASCAWQEKAYIRQPWLGVISPNCFNKPPKAVLVSTWGYDGNVRPLPELTCLTQEIRTIHEDKGSKGFKRSASVERSQLTS